MDNKINFIHGSIMSTQVTLFEKYGGWDFYHRCIYDLYLDMFDRPEISYHFIGVDIETLSKHQTQFLVRAIGGPQVYEGRPIVEVHREKEISLFQFKEIAQAFREVFIKNGVTKKDADTIMKFVASFEAQVVTRKITTIDRIMIPIYRFLTKIQKTLKKVVKNILK